MDDVDGAQVGRQREDLRRPARGPASRSKSKTLSTRSRRRQRRRADRAARRARGRAPRSELGGEPRPRRRCGSCASDGKSARSFSYVARDSVFIGRRRRTCRRLDAAQERHAQREQRARASARAPGPGASSPSARCAARVAPSSRTVALRSEPGRRACRGSRAAPARSVSARPSTKTTTTPPAMPIAETYERGKKSSPESPTPAASPLPSTAWPAVAIAISIGLLDGLAARELFAEAARVEERVVDRHAQADERRDVERVAAPCR